MALMILTPGIGIITERIFESRFMHVSELARLGADIEIEGPSAIVKGGKPLSGAPVMASDLRASAALVIAGLAAKGSTQVNVGVLSSRPRLRANRRETAQTRRARRTHRRIMTKVLISLFIALVARLAPGADGSFLSIGIKFRTKKTRGTKTSGLQRSKSGHTARPAGGWDRIAESREGQHGAASLRKLAENLRPQSPGSAQGMDRTGLRFDDYPRQSAGSQTHLRRSKGPHASIVPRLAAHPRSGEKLPVTASVLCQDNATFRVLFVMSITTAGNKSLWTF